MPACPCEFPVSIKTTMPGFDLRRIAARRQRAHYRDAQHPRFSVAVRPTLAAPGCRTGGAAGPQRRDTLLLNRNQLFRQALRFVGVTNQADEIDESPCPNKQSTCKITRLA